MYTPPHFLFTGLPLGQVAVNHLHNTLSNCQSIGIGRVLAPRLREFCCIY